MPKTSAIEALESRIAPAGVILITPDGKTASWTDVDGDTVTLKVTKGKLDQTHFTTDQSPTTGLIVTELDLTALDPLTNLPLFKGSGVTVSAQRSPLTGGDGVVNFGYLDATGVALGAVSIGGDLGRIDAGETLIVPTPAKAQPKAVLSLTSFSIGAAGGSTLPVGVTQTSELVGKVGPIKVRGDITGVLINVTGGALGTIDSISLGGSLVGTDDADSGRITTSGAIGPVTIKGSVIGGGGQHSGSIEAAGLIKSVSIGGSIYGGRSDNPSTDGTGVIRSEFGLGKVTVAGSIVGGSQQDSGLISSAGNVASISVGAGITGGSAGTGSGGIFVGGNVASISIKGDVLGGSAQDSGFIVVDGKATSVSINGSVIGGQNEGTGVIDLGTSVADTVTSLTITRNLVGGTDDNSGVVQLAASVGKLTIGGSIKGGTDDDTGLLQLGNGATSVSIAGDVTGSTGTGSGRIVSFGKIGTLSIGGSLLGGTANDAGSVVSSDIISKFSIGANVLGADLADGAVSDLENSGLIQAKAIGSLSILGAVRTGIDYDSGSELVNNAAIRVAHNIGTLSIKGGVEGNLSALALITARGEEIPVANSRNDRAFGNVSIGGSVRHANILAGYNTTADHTAAESNPNAQMGIVSIAGDWIASNLIAGAKWSKTFGDGDDVKSSGVDNPNTASRIDGVKISGQVVGTAGDNGDHFGFVAEAIVSMTVGTAKGSISVPNPVVGMPAIKIPRNAILINTGRNNDNDPVSARYNLAPTLDVRLFELPEAIV